MGARVSLEASRAAMEDSAGVMEEDVSEEYILMLLLDVVLDWRRREEKGCSWVDVVVVDDGMAARRRVVVKRERRRAMRAVDWWALIMAVYVLIAIDREKRACDGREGVDNWSLLGGLRSR